MSQKEEKKRGSFLWGFLKFLIGVILVALIAGYIIFKHYYGMLNKISEETLGDVIIEVPEDSPKYEEVLSGMDDEGDTENDNGGTLLENAKRAKVRTVLVVGVDSLEDDTNGRSDSMILLSVDPATDKVLVTSFLRDIYVDIPGVGGDRLNAAYAYGKTDLLKATIEANFGIPVDNVMVINFYFVRDFVDAVGGVDVELTAEEIEILNGYLISQNDVFGLDLTGDALPNEPGVYTLSGNQALAYSRIRYIGTDFARTGRQRNVLGLCVDKARGMNISQLNSLVKEFFPRITTDLSEGDCISLIWSCIRVAGNYEASELVIPAEGTWNNALIDDKAVLVVDFEENTRIWYERMGK